MNSSGKVTGVSAGQVTITLIELVQVKEFVQTGEFTLDGDQNGICEWSLPFFVQISKNIKVKPALTSISPERGLIGATTAVTIDGNGFGTNPTVQAGSGITVNVTSASNTKVSAEFVVANNAPTGNHSVTVTAGGQQSESKNFFVQIPMRFHPVSFMQSAEVCPLGQFGALADVQYRVFDQSGNSILRAGMIPQEIVVINGVQRAPNFGPFATPPTTDSAGFFNDIPIGTCFGPPTPVGNPCADVSQTFNIRIPTSLGDLVFPITTTTVGRDCALGIRLQVVPGGTFTIGTVN